MVYFTLLFVIIGICFTKAEKNVHLNLSKIDYTQFTSISSDSSNYRIVIYKPIAEDTHIEVIDDGIPIWADSDGLKLETAHVYYKDLVAHLVHLKFIKSGVLSSKYYKRDSGTFKEVDKKQFEFLKESNDFSDNSLVLDLNLGFNEKYFNISYVNPSDRNLKRFELKENLDLLELKCKDQVLLNKSSEGALVSAYVLTETYKKLKIMLDLLKDQHHRFKLFEFSEGYCKELGEYQVKEFANKFNIQIDPQAASPPGSDSQADESSAEGTQPLPEAGKAEEVAQPVTEGDTHSQAEGPSTEDQQPSTGGDSHPPDDKATLPAEKSSESSQDSSRASSPEPPRGSPPPQVSSHSDQPPPPLIIVTPATPTSSDGETYYSPTPLVAPPTTPVSTETEFTLPPTSTPGYRTLEDLVGPEALRQQLKEAHASLESDDLTEELLKQDAEDRYVPAGLGSTTDFLSSRVGSESEDQAEEADLAESEFQPMEVSEAPKSQPEEAVATSQPEPEVSEPESEVSLDLPQSSATESEGSLERPQTLVSDADESLEKPQELHSDIELPPSSYAARAESLSSPIREHHPPVSLKGSQAKARPSARSGGDDVLDLDEVDPSKFKISVRDLGNGVFERIYQPKNFEIHHVKYFMIHWYSDEDAVRCSEVRVQTLNDEIRALKLNAEYKDGSSKFIYYSPITYSEIDENKYNEILEETYNQAEHNARNRLLDLNLNLQEQLNVRRETIVQRFRNPYYRFTPEEGYKFKRIMLYNSPLWETSQSQQYLEEVVYYVAQGKPAYAVLTIPGAPSFDNKVTLDLVTRKPVQDLESFQVGFLLQKKLGEDSHILFDLVDPINHEKVKVEKQNFKEFIVRDISTRCGRVIAILDNKRKITPTNIIPFKSFKVYYHKYYPVYVVTDPVLSPRYYARRSYGWQISEEYDIEKDIRAITSSLDDIEEHPHRTLWLNYESPDYGKYLVEEWIQDEITIKTFMAALNNSFYHISCNGSYLMDDGEPRSVGVKFFVKKDLPFKAEVLIRVSEGRKKLIFKVFSQRERKWNQVDESVFENF